jgi:hypothetical protein
MSNWLDDVEAKKRQEQAKREAEMEQYRRRTAERLENEERMYQSVQHKSEPIFLRLESLVERANKNGFFLLASRLEKHHGLSICRYQGWYERHNFDMAGGPVKITLHPVHLGKGVTVITEAYIRCFPRWEGMELSFIVNSSHVPSESSRVVPYHELTEDRLLEFVKWIATGKEPLPFQQKEQLDSSASDVDDESLRNIALILLFILLLIIVVCVIKSLK